MTIFEILAEPTRRQILDLIREKPRLVGDLVEILQITQPNVSKHLRVLREANLVKVRREAQWRWYELNPEPLSELAVWLEPYRQQMEDRYNRLENLLDQLQREEKEEQDE